MRGWLAEGLARLVVASQVHAWPVLAGAALLALLAGAGSWRYAGIDSDLGRLIRPSGALAWHRYDEDFKSAFPDLQQTAVVVVSGADGAAVNRTAAEIARVLRSRPELDYVFAPTTDGFFAEHRLYYLDAGTLQSWIRGLELDYGALLRLAESADLANAAVTFADLVTAGTGLPLPDPLVSLARSFEGDGRIEIRLDGYPPLEPSAQRHYAVLQVKGVQRHDQTLPGAELVALLEDVRVAIPVDPGVEVRLTGEVVLANEEMSAALRGIGIAGTVSLVLLGVILGMGVRSLRIMGGIFLLLLLGTPLTLGLATLTVGTFNTLALMFVVMFFGLGVDFAVHFALRVRDAHAGGLPDLQATATAARDVGPALVLCTATSSIAFLAFTPTAYRGLGELGIISAGGMAVALLLTLTLLPALFGAFGMPTGSWGKAPERRRGWRPGPVPVLAATLVLALGALWWARDLQFDYSVLALRDAHTEGMSTLLELQRADITTDYSISVLAEDAAMAESLRGALSVLPEVADVTIPADWVPGQQVEKRRMLDQPAELLATIDPVRPGNNGQALKEALAYLTDVEDAVPAERRDTYRVLRGGLTRVADEPETVDRLNRSLQRELEVSLEDLHEMLGAEPFTLDDLPADVHARMVTRDDRHLVIVEPAGVLANRAATEAFITAVANVAPNYAGRAVVEWGVGGVVVQSFLQAAGIAVAGIVVLLVIYFRSTRLALLVLVPLLLATLFTFALAELLGMTLNMANILVVPLIFGLGVDTGIHVVHRFDDGGIDAVFRTSTARAVTISGLTTIGTFFSLSFSPHQGAASVGLLLSLAIALMLAVTYVVLPAMLRLAGGRMRKLSPSV